MIALAGMIGTGLFLSSGSALAQSGPLGCVLGFIVVGVRLKSALPTINCLFEDGHCYCFDRCAFLTLATYQLNLPYFEAYSSAEMSAFKPAGGGFVRHATMWLDKSTGIAIGYVHSIPISILMIVFIPDI